MEKFYFEVPGMNRKEEAVEYINEFYEYNSDINGSSGLQRYLNDYEGWLQKLEEDYNRIPDEENVPARTYFLIRESDNRIVGMIKIRLALNESLRKSVGNIGYSICPVERGKGYNKVNLYLGLKVCQKYGLKNVMLDAYENNPASWKTMEALGGVMTKKYVNEDGVTVRDYEIAVDESLQRFSELYELQISEKHSI